VPAQHLEPNQTADLHRQLCPHCAADLAQGSLENTRSADGTTLNGAVSSPPSSATLGFGPRLALTKAITTAAALFASARCSPTLRRDQHEEASRSPAPTSSTRRFPPAWCARPPRSPLRPPTGPRRAAPLPWCSTAAALSPDGTLTNTRLRHGRRSFPGRGHVPDGHGDRHPWRRRRAHQDGRQPAPLLGQTVTFTVTATNYGRPRRRPSPSRTRCRTASSCRGQPVGGQPMSRRRACGPSARWRSARRAPSRCRPRPRVPTTIVNTATRQPISTSPTSPRPTIRPPPQSARSSPPPTWPVTKDGGQRRPRTVGDTVTFTVTANQQRPLRRPGRRPHRHGRARPLGHRWHAVGGSFDPASGVWTLGNVAVGAVATLQVTGHGARRRGPRPTWWR